jgi:molybdopterin molybdotransferase
LVLVKPALAVLAGKPQPGAGWIKARLSGGFAHRGDRTTFHPARVADAGVDTRAMLTVETLAWSGSADLRAVSVADGFAIFAAGEREYAPGEIVDFLPMRCPG